MRGNSALRFGLLYTQTQINDLNGEWRIGGQLGDEIGAAFEIHQPLDPLSRYFVAGRVGYLSRPVGLFDDEGNQLARLQLGAWGVDVAGGREFGTWGEGRLGYRRFTGDAEIQVGPPGPNIDTDRGEAYFRLAADEMDDLNFPKSGFLAQIEYNYASESLGARADYEQIQFLYSHAILVGSKYTHWNVERRYDA